MDKEQLEAILSNHPIINRPNYPFDGFNFPDINNILNNHPEILAKIIQEATTQFPRKDVNRVASIETYGAYFAAPVAYQLKVGIVPIKKAGKFPGEVIREKYDMVYANGKEVEMQVDAIQKGDKILVIDDFLASGGSFFATKKLIELQGGIIVGAYFAVDVPIMGGNQKVIEAGIPLGYAFQIGYDEKLSQWNVLNKDELVARWSD